MKSSTFKSALVIGILAGAAGLQATDASAAAGGPIQACKQDAKAKSLKGDELKTFMTSCKLEARKTCKTQAKSAGSDKVAQHDFIKACMKGEPTAGATTAPTAPGSTVAVPAATPQAPKP